MRLRTTEFNCGGHVKEQRHRMTRMQDPRPDVNGKSCLRIVAGVYTVYSLLSLDPDRVLEYNKSSGTPLVQ